MNSASAVVFRERQLRNGWIDWHDDASLSLPSPVVPLARPPLKSHGARPCVSRCCRHRSTAVRAITKLLVHLKHRSQSLADDVIVAVIDKAATVVEHGQAGPGRASS